MKKKHKIFLVAPNVSEQMGGEAIKALQIFLQLRKTNAEAIQVTHARNRDELAGRLALDGILYVEENWVSLFLWRSVILRMLLDIWFAHAALNLIKKYAEKRGIEKNDIVIHQTEPNSPVIPRLTARGCYNVFGPVNGNIYYPRVFRSGESLSARLRRILHFPLQTLNRLLWPGMRRANYILVAGGDRTFSSLKAAGVSDSIMVESLDCGINDELLNRPRIQHKNENYRFVHFGRLVFHKGTALIIEALAKCKKPVSLDVVGRGPELKNCKELAKRLGVESRVNFKDWYPNHSDLIDSLASYRGFVLPSFEDANGIVVQEGMALGLPGICLDWGGPQLLINHGISGFLVKPESRGVIISEIAGYMDRLAVDAELAESFSIAARNSAQEWRWSKVVSGWTKLYESKLTQ